MKNKCTEYRQPQITDVYVTGLFRLRMHFNEKFKLGLYIVCMYVSYFNICTPSGVVGWLKRLM